MKTLYLPGPGFDDWLRNNDCLYFSDGIEECMPARPGLVWVQIRFAKNDHIWRFEKTKHETSIPVTDPVLLAFYAPTGD